MTDADSSPTGDPLIEQSEKAEAEARAAKAARLFDIRRLIGGLFLIYGVILTVLGLGESDKSIAKSADINVNLYAGIGMLIMSALFIAWALWRPLGEDEESEPAGGGSGGGGDDAVGARAAGGRGGTGAPPSGGGQGGGSGASTAPPKPPPIMRAPAAPARLSRSTVAS